MPLPHPPCLSLTTIIITITVIITTTITITIQSGKFSDFLGLPVSNVPILPSISQPRKPARSRWVTECFLVVAGFILEVAGRKVVIYSPALQWIEFSNP